MLRKIMAFLILRSMISKSGLPASGKQAAQMVDAMLQELKQPSE